MSDTLASKPGGEAGLAPGQTDAPQHPSLDSGVGGYGGFDPASTMTGTLPGLDPNVQIEDNSDNTAWGSVKIPL